MKTRVPISIEVLQAQERTISNVGYQPEGKVYMQGVLYSPLAGDVLSGMLKGSKKTKRSMSKSKTMIEFKPVVLDTLTARAWRVRSADATVAVIGTCCAALNPSFTGTVVIVPLV